MNQQKSILRIAELLSRCQHEIELLNSADLYDINKISEYALIPVLKEIFDASNLMNANDLKKNFPAIDLIDTEKKIAFQVTSTSTITNHSYVVKKN